MSRRITPMVTVWILMLLLTGSAGCKSGDALSSTIVPATPSFEAETVTATERYVTLRTRSIVGGRIVLDIVLGEVDEPVSGVAFKITYPNSFSRFISCDDGELFPTGTCYFSEPASGSGEVFIGRTVSGAGATTVDGEKVVVRAEFLVFGEGMGPIEFVGQNLGGGDTSAVLDDVNGDPILMEWFEGTLAGQE